MELVIVYVGLILYTHNIASQRHLSEASHALPKRYSLFYSNLNYLLICGLKLFARAALVIDVSSLMSINPLEVKEINQWQHH